MTMLKRTGGAPIALSRAGKVVDYYLFLYFSCKAEDFYKLAPFEGSWQVGE